MNLQSTCATMGGSVPGLTATCPACGWPELPTISPERLHLLCDDNGVALPPLPDGDLPVHGAGRWYRMPQAGWDAYKALCESRTVLLTNLCAEGLRG